MAPQWAWWTLMKLRHPFTPDDLLVSRLLLSSLELPSSTSQFVVALRDPQFPEKVVYVLAVEKLSERSIEDIHSLVEAVNPGSVVAFVDAQYMTEALEEGNLLNSQASPDVPTSFLNVIRTCFTEKIKASGYESRAGLRVLTNIFGTTFYGNVFAARKAAEKSQADFQYLRFPSTAITSFSDGEEEDAEDAKDVTDVREDLAVSTSSSSDRFLDRFSILLGGGNFENLTSASQRVTTLSPSSQGSKELRALAPAVASNLTNTAVTGLPSAPADHRREKSAEAAEDDDCPSFAVSFYPLFLDLHELFKETPGVNQSLNYARRLLVSVEQGEEVDCEDVSRARLFRVAVESVRLSWQSFVRIGRPSASSKAADFSQLPFEEKCNALLAHALQHQAQKFSSVVAVVDASSVPGIRRHWNTAIPPEVAAYAEYCFVGLDGEDGREEGRTLSSFFESPETKAAVMMSAGAAGAVCGGLCCLPHWASFPAVVKVFSFKVPMVLKLVWMQMKRQAVVGWASTKTVMPAALKATGSKAIFAPSSSSAKAVLLKSAASAEKARVAAHGVVATAEKASLHAIRTAFYNLMRRGQARTLRGSRPWVMMGSSLATAGAVMWYGDEIEHAISIVPQAPAVVRLGRGLENMEQASKVVDNYEDTRWWNRVYSALYRRPQPL